MRVALGPRSTGTCTLACACWLGAATALAAPVVPPGELLGIELGTPLKPGYYLLDTAAYGGTTNGSRDGFNIPIFLASLPSTALGGRVEPFISEPNLFADRVGAGPDHSGVYNTLAGAVFAWKLTEHVGFSYLIGVYFPSGTTIAFASGSTRQGFSLSYGDDDWSATAHLTYGTMFNEVARFSDGTVQRNADYLNIELAALRKFGAFELGPVALGTTDLPSPRSFTAAGYVRSGEFAVGTLAGYDFGPASLQAYITRAIAERGTAGPDTQGWVRLVVPLASDATSSLPSRLVDR